MGMGSATGGGSPSSPGGKGGSSSTSYPGSSSPMVAEEYPPRSPGGSPSSPGGKGAPNSPGGKGAPPNSPGGSPNSPGGKGGMPNQLPGTQQPQQPNPYQQPYQQQFMPPPQQQFSMPSPQQQQQQRLYDLMRGIDNENLGQQQTQQQQSPSMAMPYNPDYGNPYAVQNSVPMQQQQQTGIPDFARSYASNALQAAGNMPPQGYGGLGGLNPAAASNLGAGIAQLMGGRQATQQPPNAAGQNRAAVMPQRRTTPAPQRQGGLGAAIQRQPSFRPQQMQQDPFQNSIRNQQLALQQQAIRSAQQQRTQANTASAARQQAAQQTAQQTAQQPYQEPYYGNMYG